MNRSAFGPVKRLDPLLALILGIVLVVGGGLAIYGITRSDGDTLADAPQAIVDATKDAATERALQAVAEADQSTVTPSTAAARKRALRASKRGASINPFMAPVKDEGTATDGTASDSTTTVGSSALTNIAGTPNSSSSPLSASASTPDVTSTPTSSFTAVDKARKAVAQSLKSAATKQQAADGVDASGGTTAQVSGSTSGASGTAKTASSTLTSTSASTIGTLAGPIAAGTIAAASPKAVDGTTVAIPGITVPTTGTSDPTMAQVTAGIIAAIPLSDPVTAAMLASLLNTLLTTPPVLNATQVAVQTAIAQGATPVQAAAIAEAAARKAAGAKNPGRVSLRIRAGGRAHTWSRLTVNSILPHGGMDSVARFSKVSPSGRIVSFRLARGVQLPQPQARGTVCAKRTDARNSDCLIAHVRSGQTIVFRSPSQNGKPGALTKVRVLSVWRNNHRIDGRCGRCQGPGPLKKRDR